MHDDGYFDEDVAATYDRDHGRSDGQTVESTVSALAQLAASGPALEFAIGTGRIALPLKKRGVEVEGIELSGAMVKRLREKEGGAEVTVTIGDMSTARVNGQFSLVYLVFNTICNLTSQEAQIACFRNASAHLKRGGHFVIEVDVPPLQRLPFGETRLAFGQSPRHWGIDEIDVVTQQFFSHHIWTENGALKKLSIPFRYVWPSELDLMAQLAGFEFKERWGNWQREPFTKRSASHVSVWRKPT